MDHAKTLKIHLKTDGWKTNSEVSGYHDFETYPYGKWTNMANCLISLPSAFFDQNF